ncbi:MAG TPA: ABC transporter permease [Blastocatellia bacterium]|nr:ABC transporter permease [Blastocatellia bacterium]
MDSFVIGQIVHRRTRSVLTVLGVSIGVVLVTLTVGLAHGQLAERGRREASTGAEILFRPPGSGMSALQATLAIDLSVENDLRSVEGVDSVVALGQHLERVKTGFGWQGIDGVVFDDYARVSGLKIVEGRPFVDGADEAVVDEVFARKPEGRVGSTVEFAGRPFTIVGVYSPESMSRVKIPLSIMQDYYNARGSASLLMIKVAPGADVEAVARRVRDKFPDNQIILSRDLPAFYSQGVPALNTFLNVVVALSTTISTLVILLTMYTTVIERTRQIGILKSLGASRGFIAGKIEAEAILISTVGVAFGFVVAVVAGIAIRRAFNLQIEFEPRWFVITGFIGVLSGALGALYPALRAANLDPVDALAYE